MTQRAPATSGIPLAEIIGEAFANLRVQGRRSALALLGILIGTASIVALLNIGHIAQLETLKLFRHLGVDTVQLQATPTGEMPPGFDPDVVAQLPARDPDVLRAVPIITGRASISAGRQTTDAGIVGMPPAFAATVGLAPRLGRLFRPIDNCSPVALVGKGTAEKLSAPGAELLPGAAIIVGNYGFTVIGILMPTALEAINPSDYNESVIVPLACSRRVVAGGVPNIVLAKLRPTADPDIVGQRLSAMLANPRSAIQVISARTYIKTMNAQKAVHSRMLAAVGAISLLVGGIGVMNVMLMTVKERTREIGIRIATGARQRDILRQFVTEAVMVSLVGGAMGAAVGLLIVGGLVSADVPVGLSLLPILGAFGCALVTGLVFGFMPALRAARLDPVKALAGE